MAVLDREYIIRKGRHRSGFYFSPILRKESVESVSRVVGINQSMLYNFGSIDNWDVNKLWGYSFGFHHRNSIRMGWSVSSENEGKRIQLYAYIYNRGKRIIIKISDPILPAEKDYFVKTSICIERDDRIRVDLIDYKGIFCSESIPFIVPSGCYWGYWLFPYFGGNKCATHDVRVPIYKGFPFSGQLKNTNQDYSGVTLPTP